MNTYFKSGELAKFSDEFISPIKFGYNVVKIRSARHTSGNDSFVDDFILSSECFIILCLVSAKDVQRSQAVFSDFSEHFVYNNYTGNIPYPQTQLNEYYHVLVKGKIFVVKASIIEAI